MGWRGAVGACLVALMVNGDAFAASADDPVAVIKPCRACHGFAPGSDGMAGPNLAGLIGRRVAGDPRFDYSPALRAAGDSGAVWDEDALDAFLADPETMYPGTWMSYTGARDPDERRRIIRALVDG